MFIVGTVKIDTMARVKAMFASLDSMKPMAHLISGWRLNIAGALCAEAAEEITHRWDNVRLTTDGERAPYLLIQDQIDSIDQDALLLFWQEDHWFVCPHIAMWEYVLDAFRQSSATYLQSSHLRTAWKRKGAIWKPTADQVLFKEYLVNIDAQQQIWQRYSKASVLGIPSVFKRQLLERVINSRQEHLWQNLSPAGFEIPYGAGPKFLDGFSYTEMIPTFHVFREAWGDNWQLRAMSTKDALVWIGLRDDGSRFGGSYERF